VIVAAYWALIGYLVSSDQVISTSFMATAGGCLLMTLAFVIWWLANGRIPWSERWLALGVAVIGGVAAVMVSLDTLSPMGAIFFGLPVLFTAWIVWLLASRPLGAHTRRTGLLIAIALVWTGISLVRVDGLNGAMIPSAHWRWTPTTEQRYLAERGARASQAADAAPVDAGPLALAPGDWPSFRGPGFLGRQDHAPIATDWSQSPPKLLWKRRIGPAWSSLVVIGDRLFTQEQRGEDEATVCLDAASGREIWAHVDRARFWDGQAGPGPRGTPTFHEGRLYAYGATGILNCLDAATGRLIWRRDVADETAAPLPMWGFSSSPLVVDGLVIVFAGAPDDQGLVAYRADTGEPAWSAASGPISYSTAQPATLCGQPQVLLLTDTGVVAVEVASGKRLWSYDANGSGIWRVVQPRPVGDRQVLVGSEDIGFALVDVARDGNAWTAREAWKTRGMRPAFNDCVVLDNVAYGFDQAIFCAIDLETGKRRWKAGRYGYGQVLLLRPQNVMIVLTERGEVVLLAANPEKHQELGRFQAIEGKTWNHPVVAHGRLYVRNDTEMATFELAPAAGVADR
jgi:outer membrane protein assembly factor BamB